MHHFGLLLWPIAFIHPCVWQTETEEYIIIINKYKTTENTEKKGGTYTQYKQTKENKKQLQK